MQNDDKRKYLRLNVDILVKYSIPGQKDTKETTSHNISTGGIQLDLTEQVANKTILSMEIYLPNNPKPIPSNGEVIWQAEKPNLAGKIPTGVKYLQSSYASMEKLTNFLLKYIKHLLVAKKEETASQPEEAVNLREMLTRERRMLGDKSPTINAPSFLMKEMNIPGDKVRYCRIQSGVSIKFKLAGSAEEESTSFSQYVSGGAVWLLLERQLPDGINMLVKLDLPEEKAVVTVAGTVESSSGKIYCDDKHMLTLYETKVKFSNIGQDDREMLIRYVYSCRHDYIMLGKNPPSDWV